MNSVSLSLRGMATFTSGAILPRRAGYQMPVHRHVALARGSIPCKTVHGLSFFALVHASKHEVSVLFLHGHGIWKRSLELTFWALHKRNLSFRR